jgi:hypothetical protein
MGESYKNGCSRNRIIGGGTGLIWLRIGIGGGKL